MAKIKTGVDFSADNTERAEMFFETLRKEIAASTEKIIMDAENEKEKIIEKANDESLRKAYDDIQGSARKTESKYALITAKKELEIRQNILRHRMEVTDRIFDNVVGKINVFRSTEKYPVYLSKLLSEIELSDGMIVYLSADDMKYKDTLGKDAGAKISFEADKLIKLGGLSVFIPEKSVIIDKTIDSAFNDEKKAFSSSGIMTAGAVSDNDLN